LDSPCPFDKFFELVIGACDVFIVILMLIVEFRSRSEAARMMRAGSLVLMLDTTSRSQGAGKKEAIPWYVRAAFAAGWANTLISALLRQAMMDAYRGVTMLTWARREEFLRTTAKATLPFPLKPANLLIGSRIIPPRFLKLWTKVILLLASAANTAMLVSLVSKASLVLFAVVWAHAVEYTVVSLLPLLLPGQLTKWVCQFWDATIISISIASGLSPADVRELGSAVAKNNNCCHSTLSPASNGHHVPGLPKTQVHQIHEAGC
jgi:hypothetical protein